MKSFTAGLPILALAGLLAAFVVEAGKPVDNDGDGVSSVRDCDDGDPTVWDLNSCGLCSPEPPPLCQHD